MFIKKILSQQIRQSLQRLAISPLGIVQKEQHPAIPLCNKQQHLVERIKEMLTCRGKLISLRKSAV